MNYEKEVKRLNDIIAAYTKELEKRANSTINFSERVAHQKDLDLLKSLLVGGK